MEVALLGAPWCSGAAKMVLLGRWWCLPAACMLHPLQVTHGRSQHSQICKLGERLR